MHRPLRIMLFLAVFACAAATTPHATAAAPALDDVTHLIVLPDVPEHLILPPAVGTSELRILSPTILELTLVTTELPDQRPAQWDFVAEGGRLQLPAADQFTVTADGKPVAVRTVGFKRRVLYAPLARRDLRIGNCLYLELQAPLPETCGVRVTAPSGAPGSRTLSFVATSEPRRWSPAIHVNQAGYGRLLPKHALVGYALGSLGELALPAAPEFVVVDATSGTTVFRGALRPRPDRGFTYAVLPYQKVYDADFTGLEIAGRYRLVVPGLGASFAFSVTDGFAGELARTYALGLYHQRCGTELALPFTRFTHAACHTAPAQVPDMTFKHVRKVLADATADTGRNPEQTAPRMLNVEASLYPFVRTGKLDVAGGHHDAGDYSKYTINSAQFIHYLVFAADALPGAGALDNLGIPESGDGRSDLLQIAKWEADFLAKMQDSDGGFYFLVYPRDRKYEGNVLPQNGDPQVLLPKTTVATAAASAALAQAASSPLFRKQFPEAAARYLQQARKGWGFLERAWAEHGRRGAFQKITHYGALFMDDDEIAWAATELFLATGEKKYQTLLVREFDPASPKTIRWGWQRLAEAYGCAVRSYAFAERTGRIAAERLQTEHLRKCREQLIAAADDSLAWSQACAYGTSYPLESKRHRVAGWYFAAAEAFPLTVAYQLDPRPAWLEALVRNLDFDLGTNPNNVCFLTGLGWRRQCETVHQWAQNDERTLPPSGIPLGSIQSGFAYLDKYRKELGALCFPRDGDANAPYPFYDRWGDSFNTTTEFVAATQARSLASLVFLMARTPLATQPWRAAPARITGSPATAPVGKPVNVSLGVDGLELAEAVVVWEARGAAPATGATFTFTPTQPGPQWIEAEACWPDGRRIFATARIEVTAPAQ